MSRTVDEWIGRNDDEPVPPRVRVRVFERDEGRCRICTRKISAGDRWVCDHVQAIVNGGANRESNLQTICSWCDRTIKTPADVGEKSRVYRKRAKDIGAWPKSKRPLRSQNTFKRGTYEQRS
jgi:5-methylcytosine-specific restriction protein A